MTEVEIDEASDIQVFIPDERLSATAWKVSTLNVNDKDIFIFRQYETMHCFIVIKTDTVVMGLLIEMYSAVILSSHKKTRFEIEV